MLESTKAKVKPDWETPMTASCWRPSSTEAIWILDRRRRPVPVLVDGAELLGPDPFPPSRCLLFRRVDGEKLIPSLSPPRFFFLGQKFLPEGTDIIGYREISKISLIFRTS
jgi:hypothetical protein